MNQIFLQLMLLVPAGDVDGTPTYHLINPTTDKVVEYAYKEEVKQMFIDGTFQYNEDLIQTQNCE